MPTVPGDNPAQYCLHSTAQHRLAIIPQADTDGFLNVIIILESGAGVGKLLGEGKNETREAGKARLPGDGLNRLNRFKTC